MFLCSFIEELCTKEENNKTGCSFNFEHQCIYKIIQFYTKVYTVSCGSLSIHATYLWLAATSNDVTFPLCYFKLNLPAQWGYLQVIKIK